VRAKRIADLIASNMEKGRSAEILTSGGPGKIWVVDRVGAWWAGLRRSRMHVCLDSQNMTLSV
jgi:hypothetical protein